VADATATLEFDGLNTLMKTAVLATLPEAAVTVPLTVNVPAPVTEIGVTLTVTKSEAADVLRGTRTRSATRSGMATTVQEALFISCR
jgi:hypothetical protein